MSVPLTQDERFEVAREIRAEARVLVDFAEGFRHPRLKRIALELRDIPLLIAVPGDWHESPAQLTDLAAALILEAKQILEEAGR